VRILIADKFSEKHLERLGDLGHDCSYQPALKADDLAAAVAGHDALVVRSTRVDAATIEAADRLALIIRAGAGVNTIAVDAAAGRAVFVCNTPGKNAIAVAELAMGLILAIDRNIPDNVIDLRNSRWNKKKYSQTRGLAGRNLGIVGIGAIGLALARRARAFDMNLIAIERTDRRKKVQRELDKLDCTMVPNIETLAATSDIISFHVPATPETHGLVSRRLLTAVRSGTVIINTARGNIIDEAALLEAIEAKDLRVGLDVYGDEPGSGEAEYTSRLAQHPNVYGTHHIGASTEQAQKAIADAVLEVITAYESGTLLNCVNLGEAEGSAMTVTIRHRNRVGVLAAALTALREAGLNVEHMENFVLAGRNAASAVIHVVGTVEAETVRQIEALDNVMAVSVTRR
jgi:D-3-phosphoglycerate dehydrogenase